MLLRRRQGLWTGVRVPQRPPRLLCNPLNAFDAFPLEHALPFSTNLLLSHPCDVQCRSILTDWTEELARRRWRDDVKEEGVDVDGNVKSLCPATRIMRESMDESDLNYNASAVLGTCI
jgi:hypothetical protein